MDYPDQVCHDCATEAGGKTPEGHLSSVDTRGTCDVCGHQKAVTEPRDYGYPTFKPRLGFKLKEGIPIPTEKGGSHD